MRTNEICIDLVIPSVGDGLDIFLRDFFVGEGKRS